MFKRALAYDGIDIAATVLAPGMHSLGEVATHKELMKKAYEAGRTAVTSSGGFRSRHAIQE
jgi:hypothetical protein